MIQKHRINTEIGTDKTINIELKQDFDLLEILSLKFTQQEAYTSICADYGVVCGRVVVNNGFGIPNARVSIFVPITDVDETDPVVSALYPFKSSTDTNEEGYRYNLLPSRKQHGGHTPTGTFFDQEDILTREECLEVFEKYYKYTAKTNSAGDFMIWGVPLGDQQIHVDIDLSDMGCFSLRPYDFIRQGTAEDRFDRFYRFKSDSDLDGLPQIVSFKRAVEVTPFWGNKDLCQIGINRVDFDLSNFGIKVAPISLVLVSSVTDDESDAVKKSGVIRMKTGYKCNLQTETGSIEGVRYTGKKVIGSDGVSIYPELEYFNPGIIEEDGSAMMVVEMNMDYTYTNEFGELEITNDPNKGIPTTTVARLRMSLDNSDQQARKVTQSAHYLIPNIREFNNYTNGTNNNGEYSEALLSTYTFSDVFEDYFKVPAPTGVTLESLTTLQRTHKKELMLGEYPEYIPKDYFYKFIYGKVYTPSSFQGSHYETSGIESFFGLARRDAFLGIKEIRPNAEDDCSGNANYLPTNFGFKNRIKFNLIIAEILLFVQFVYSIVLLKFAELVGSFFWSVAQFFYDIYFGWPFNWRPFERFSEQLKDLAYRISDRLTQQLSLTIYPDCEECSTDDSGIVKDISSSNNYCRVSEASFYSFKFDVALGLGKGVLLVIPNNASSAKYKNLTTDPTFLSDRFVGQYAKDDGGQCSGTTSPSYSQLDGISSLTATVPDDPSSNHRYYAEFYPSPSSGTQGSFTPFIGALKPLASHTDSSDITVRTYTSGSDPVLDIIMTSFLPTVGGSVVNGAKYISFTIQEWLDITGVNLDESGVVPDNTILRIYDRATIKDPSLVGTSLTIESGCEKYDKFYNEANAYKYFFGTGAYGSPTDPLNPPTYSTGYLEQTSATPPSGAHSLLSTISGGGSTRRLPYKQSWRKISNATYDRKTKSGLTEIRDGVFTVIPVIDGETKNTNVILEWYRRKRVGAYFCGGVVNYSYVDNWLNGLLYFFKFDFTLRWDNVSVLDLNQRGSKFPRELVFYNVLDQKFYYRSTPYNPTTKTFIGQNVGTYVELLHPTTFYDVGVRDEFFDEICFDPQVDPNCSVIRDLTVTSYQDPGQVLEHVINYRMDASQAKFDINDFFTGQGMGSNMRILDGDVRQLMSINCEAGIEAFDLDTVQYFIFNGEYLDPEDPTYASYFKNSDGSWGATPIDFKLDQNGRTVRLCLNKRLGDYTQEVPFYLWDKLGEGFGINDLQSFKRNSIAVRPLQRMLSLSGATATTTNYLMADGEEEYIMKPMTKTHGIFSYTGNFPDMLERFEVITLSGSATPNATLYVEGDLWLEVITYGASGFRKDPYTGNIRVVLNGAWSSPIGYISNQGANNTEMFIFPTANNYAGSLQTLSTGFHFYFGLRPGATAYDKFIKYYGPKGAFPSAE